MYLKVFDVREGANKTYDVGAVTVVDFKGVYFGEYEARGSFRLM